MQQMDAMMNIETPVFQKITILMQKYWILGEKHILHCEKCL